MTRDEIKDQIEENLRGDCCCDYITKKEMMEYLDDLDKWLETAKMAMFISTADKDIS